ncbi:hypothetical protein TNCV_2486391 [Trichonephila clavipes]|uniref:Uncharacterized protein n=1 Tax=Trichonephila clavipes TaxID=2585209 RepID=A0A8X7BCC5_TRICX|nr:hypothetical protein TNCV_2486391 [Trichonephila clavipes]
MRGLAARRIFKVHPCRKGAKLLQTSVPSRGFELRPYGTTVSVSNHCIRWVAIFGTWNQEILNSSNNILNDIHQASSSKYHSSFKVL